MQKFIVAIVICFVFTQYAGGQTSEKYSWWNPTSDNIPVVEGQAWPKEVKNFYDRLPARAEQKVTRAVWNQSRCSAGLYIKFKTDACSIKIRYEVTSKGDFAMPHMPATGVSGVDLYAIDHSGKWVWGSGKYQFGDTITYEYNNLEVDKNYRGRVCEFRIFLPLYNTVNWMEIGVPEGKTFIPMPLDDEKPIVVYGTSIAQGACASRPGLAWTAILERQLDYPLINLGFSGNGVLAKPVIDLMAEIDAKIYVLDCLPNMTYTPVAELERRIRESVKGLQAKHPSTPILLVEHNIGTTTGLINEKWVNDCEKSSEVLRQTFAKMMTEGVKNIFLLSNTEFGFDINSTVELIHPNDIGMKKYADAYSKIIREIVNEPSGAAYTTTQPIIQDRDGYDWRGRHNEIIALNKKDPPQNIIIANSIIHYWAGEPKDPIVRGEDSWNRYLAPLGLRNLGFGYDRLENALWRIYHGELDGYTAKHVVVMIGTNNMTTNTNDEIIAGLKLLVEAIQYRQPNSGILLSGIFPRKNMEKRVRELNIAILRLASMLRISYINPGQVLLSDDSKIDESLFSDGVHPNAAGYNKLAPVLAGYLKK